MTKTMMKSLSLSLGSLFIASPVLAHTGGTAEASLLSGLIHPLTGLDHLLAMFAVGIWAAMQRSNYSYKLPVTFLLMLVAGYALGLNSISMPFIEAGIASSVLVLGLVILFTTKLPHAASIPLISLFAMYHGMAHGFEIGMANAALFGLGFITSSALLHIAGSLFARTLPQINRFAGSMIALAGFSFLIA